MDRYRKEGHALLSILFTVLGLLLGTVIVAGLIFVVSRLPVKGVWLEFCFGLVSLITLLFIAVIYSFPFSGKKKSQRQKD